MYTSISIQDKKEFIQWFLKHYEVKQWETNYLLTYLTTHEDLLENLHFVKDVSYCPRAIIIGTTCSNEPSFRYYKEQVMTEDAEKSFHDIRLHQEIPIYIQLAFLHASTAIQHVAILEDNPFMAKDLTDITNNTVDIQYLLDRLLYDQNRDTLNVQIDQSLDENDYTKFMQLTEELKRLQITVPKKRGL